eukprot:6204901-Pleurochrysis_carterae.AAC.7
MQLESTKADRRAAPDGEPAYCGDVAGERQLQSPGRQVPNLKRQKRAKTETVAKRAKKVALDTREMKAGGTNRAVKS